jgi:hypothetical protein
VEDTFHRQSALQPILVVNVLHKSTNKCWNDEFFTEDFVQRLSLGISFGHHVNVWFWQYNVVGFLQDVKSDPSINRTLFGGLFAQKLQIHPTVRGGHRL